MSLVHLAIFQQKAFSDGLRIPITNQLHFSCDDAVAVALSELYGIFTLKEEQRTPLKAFLEGRVQLNPAGTLRLATGRRHQTRSWVVDTRFNFLSGSKSWLSSFALSSSFFFCLNGPPLSKCFMDSFPVQMGVATLATMPLDLSTFQTLSATQTAKSHYRQIEWLFQVFGRMLVPTPRHFSDTVMWNHGPSCAPSDGGTFSLGIKCCGVRLVCVINCLYCWIFFSSRCVVTFLTSCKYLKMWPLVLAIVAAWCTARKYTNWRMQFGTLLFSLAMIKKISFLF